VGCKKYVDVRAFNNQKREAYGACPQSSITRPIANVGILSAKTAIESQFEIDLSPAELVAILYDAANENPSKKPFSDKTCSDRNLNCDERKQRKLI
jgi:hypothetical protein